MASLNEHTQDLDLRLTKHLLRRACFHYSKSDLDQYVGKTADEILNLLSSAKIFTMEWPNDPVTQGNLSGCAGIQDGFWLNTGHRAFPSAPESTFHAGGNSGQFVAVLPERELVVVRLGLTLNESRADMDALLADLLAIIE